MYGNVHFKRVNPSSSLTWRYDCPVLLTEGAADYMITDTAIVNINARVYKKDVTRAAFANKKYKFKYVIEIVFDNEADEAEFIIKHSDGFIIY
jgi:hypothetical protein